MKEILIGPNEAGQRLDKLLSKYLSLAPKSFIYKMLRKKNITLNHKKSEGSEHLEQGDVVKLFLSDETIQKFSKEIKKEVQSKLDILYEDQDILVINKEAGMLSQKAAKEDVSLVEHIIAYLLEKGEINEEDLKSFRPSICNRLDRNTSGIVVAGKTLSGLQTMGVFFKERTLDKYYVTIVSGQILKTETIDGYLIKDEKTNTVTVAKTQGKDGVPILTKYRPLCRTKDYTLLEVKLITGRTHQIRAHLASIGHPVLGDFKYGTSKKNQWAKEKYHLQNQLLHARRLEMPSIQGKYQSWSDMVFIAPIPSLFQKIMNDLNLREEL